MTLLTKLFTVSGLVQELHLNAGDYGVGYPKNSALTLITMEWATLEKSTIRIAME